MLQGDKIVLRPIRFEDWEKTVNWRNDLFITASTMSHPYPITDEMEMNWYKEKCSEKNNSYLPFTCCEKETDRVVGYFSLSKIDSVSQNCIVSGAIGEKGNIGKGMGKEAVELLLSYAFNYLNLIKVFAYVRTDHPALKTWMETGAVIEGTLKQHFYTDGKFRDVLIISWFKDNSLQ